MLKWLQKRPNPEINGEFWHFYMKVLIDNGHGEHTPGKCSPDGKVKEWLVARDIAHRLKEMLDDEGIPCQLVTPETEDIPVNDRVRRVNAIAKKEPCVLLSIHVNAYGNDGQWHAPCGWLAYVGLNASANSKRLATLLTKEAHRTGLRGNRAPAEPFKAQSLAMCRDTVCPAVLTENLFMDNEEDARRLLSPEWRRRIAGVHLNALKTYLA